MQYQTPSMKRITTGLLFLIASSMALADHPGTGFGASASGPITTISASTLPAGTKTIGLEVTHVKADAFIDEELARFADQHIHAHSTDSLISTTIGLGYGVTNDFTVGLRLPYIHRDNIRAGHHSHAGGTVTNEAEALGDSQGIGDLSAIGKYRFLNDSRGNQEAAVLFGLEMPTGTTSRINRGGERFETEHQPGSGSWDPLVGLAYTKRMGKTSFDTNVLYKIATRGAQATELGDQFFYNLAFSYRLRGSVGEPAEVHPHRHADGHAHYHEVPSPVGGTSVDLILELNGEWQDKLKIAGVVENNSGGNTVYLSPGIRISSMKNWAASASIGIPVAQNIGRAHTDSDWQLIVGVARAF